MNPTKKEKQSHKLWPILTAVLSVLLIGAEVLVVLRVWQLEMLPLRYFLLLLGVMALLPPVLTLMMRPRKSGKFQKHTKPALRQILGCILCTILTAACLVGAGMIGQVTNALSSITDTTVNVIMNIYVLTDAPAYALQEAAGYTFGIVGAADAPENAPALSDMEEALGTGVVTQSFQSPFDMIDGLYGGQVQAILLDNGYANILEETEGYGDFAVRTRLLHEHVSVKEVPTETTGSTQAPETTQPRETAALKGDITTTPFLIYISGNDSRLPLLADGGSDVNIIAVINPVDKQVLLINTPRDYYVVNPASGNGSRDKLSLCGLNGIDNCIGAISDLYGIDINHYARINFSGFRTLIDALGGVTVHSDFGFTAGVYYIYPGENHLNGDQALSFARERKNLAGGDNDRGKNQMKLISGMIGQLSAGNLLANYSEILGSLEGMFATSLSAQDMAKLVKMQLSDMAAWDIKTFAVTGENGSEKCWAMNNLYSYVMHPHPHMVDHAASLMEKVLAGEVLTDADMTVE